MFRSAINARGESCPMVTQHRALGTDAKREVGYVAVACSDGKRYVVSLWPDDSVRYHSTCSVWLLDNPTVKCFP